MYPSIPRDYPIVVTMPMKESDHYWQDIGIWIHNHGLDVKWKSNADELGMTPNPFLRFFCFKEEDKEAAMLFKLTWL